ncbi:MAG: hypothetical protein ABUT20_07055 [Bacteroidota bacterium]
MKRRIRKVVNFFAFNLLFFALYLNFIHKDKSNVAIVPAAVQTANTASLNGTILVSNPEKYLDQKNAATTTPAQPTNSATKAEQNAALKLSIN